MKSPFPGMDPYIEARDLWGDFHSHLIEKIYDEVSAALPKGYIARAARRSYIVLAESEEKAEQPFVPGVKVLAPRARPSGSSERIAVATAASVEEGEPISMRAFLDVEFVEKFIDIYEKPPSRRLVTSIEVLSPSNKERGSKGWKQYLRKRQAFLLGKANLVEIDLLRGGSRMPMLDPWPDSPYYLLVSREEWAPSCRVWRGYFDRPLPPIPIPLNAPDAPIRLTLQPLVEAIYERARYKEEIDYSQPLKPPLTPEQAAWLESRLRPEAAPTTPPARPRRPRRR